MKIHGVTGSRKDGLLSNDQQKALDRRQYLCAKRVQDYWGNQKRNDLYPEIAMPTGFGKGRVVHRLLKSSKHDQILTIVGSKNILLDQSQDVLAGLAMDDTGESSFSILPDLSGRTVLATWQGLTSFSRKHTKRPGFGLAVIDEAHNTGTKARIELLKWMKPEHAVGLTATAVRASGEFRAPEDYGFTVVDSMPLPECIDKRWLSPLAGVCVDTQVMLPASVRQAGNINQKKMSQALRKYPHLFSNIANDIAERFLPSGMKTVIVVNRVEQEACVIAKELMDRGYKVGLAVNEYAAKQLCDRFITLDAIRRYKLPPEHPESIQILISPQVIGEGFDAPATECVIWACPTLSHVRYTQVIGRGSRRCWMKKYCLIVDYVYMIENYGYSYNFAQFFKKEDLQELEGGFMYVGPKGEKPSIQIPYQFSIGGRIVSVVDLQTPVWPPAEDWLNVRQIAQKVTRSETWVKDQIQSQFQGESEQRIAENGHVYPHFSPVVVKKIEALAKAHSATDDEWLNVTQLAGEVDKSQTWVLKQIQVKKLKGKLLRGGNGKKYLHYPRSVIAILAKEESQFAPAGNWYSVADLKSFVGKSAPWVTAYLKKHCADAGEMRLLKRPPRPVMHYPPKVASQMKKVANSQKEASGWLIINEIARAVQKGRDWTEARLAEHFSGVGEMRLGRAGSLNIHYPPSVVAKLKKLIR